MALLVVMLGLQALVAAAMSREPISVEVYPDNEANEAEQAGDTAPVAASSELDQNGKAGDAADVVVPTDADQTTQASGTAVVEPTEADQDKHAGDIADMVVQTEDDEKKSITQQTENKEIDEEEAKMEASLKETERRDKMIQDSDRLEIKAQTSRKANFKRKLVEVAKGYKKQLFTLNDELHTCSKSHEKMSDELMYLKTKLATVRGLINQEAAITSSIKQKYGGLAQDLRTTYETDNQKIGDLIKDLNQSAVKLLNVEQKVNAEKAKTMSMSANVISSATKLQNQLVANKNARTKLGQLKNAAATLNSSVVQANETYQKWSQSLEERQEQVKKQGKALANDVASHAAAAQNLVLEAAKLGSALTAAEKKEKKVKEDLEKAQKFLAKDAELISSFQIHKAQIKADAAKTCKQKKDKLLSDLDNEAVSLEAQLERSRSSNQAMQEANKQLEAEIQKLQEQAAAAQARLKAAAIVAQKEAEEKARKEAEEKARKEAEEKAKREAEEKARKEAEEKAKKEAEEKAKKEAEEKAKKEAEEKAKKEAQEKAKKEAEEKAKKEAAEKAKKDAEEKARQAAAKKKAAAAAKKLAKEKFKQDSVAAAKKKTGKPGKQDAVTRTLTPEEKKSADKKAKNNAADAAKKMAEKIQADIEAEEAKEEAAEAAKKILEAKAAKKVLEAKAKSNKVKQVVAAAANLNAKKTEADIKADQKTKQDEEKASQPDDDSKTSDQDAAVDQELGTPDDSDVPKQASTDQSAPETRKTAASEEATSAQEEVDRAWAAEQKRKVAAEAKSQDAMVHGLDKTTTTATPSTKPKAVPTAAPAHAEHKVTAHQAAQGHNRRADDVEQQVQEELKRRHSGHISQEFTKMTVAAEDALASPKKKSEDAEVSSPYSSWSQFVHGRPRGFAAHPTKFLDLSDDTY